MYRVAAANGVVVPRLLRGEGHTRPVRAWCAAFARFARPPVTKFGSDSAAPLRATRLGDECAKLLKVKRALVVGATLLFLTLVSAAATHRYWYASRAWAEAQVKSYRWGGEDAKNVRCKGIWADGATRSSDGYRFHHLWCEARFSKGWSHFKFHVVSKTNFVTTNWACGRIGRNSCGGGAGGGSSGTTRNCGAYLGVHLTAYSYDGSVQCSTARRVYYTFAVVADDPSGWVCTGTAARGSCNGGLGIGDYEISWHR